MRRGLDTNARLGDVIEALEREIADRQRALLTLKAICSGLFKGNQGAPRKYTPEDVELVGALVDGGHTHRDIARLLRMPVATVGELAVRIGAKREGNMRGGTRVHGRINTKRKHQAIKRDGEDGSL